MLSNTQKVFGLGLSKTGTSSLTEALNILGLKSIHYPHDEQTLVELKKERYRLSILKEYQSITDLPAVPFYTQFDKVYPGSKFILTVRELSEWLRSCEMHWQLIAEWLDNFPQFKKSHEFFSSRVYGGLTFDRDRFANVYQEHERTVQNYFRGREDFLILDICSGEGWEKLCSFLAVQKPDLLFPHANEWMHLLLKASEDLRLVVPSGTTLILIDEDGFGRGFARGRHRLSFMKGDGGDWGAPADDATALAEFEHLLKSRQPDYIVFGWPAYWWLDHYPKFAGHLRSSFPCVMENERLTVFDLRSGVNLRRIDTTISTQQTR